MLYNVRLYRIHNNNRSKSLYGYLSTIALTVRVSPFCNISFISNQFIIEDPNFRWQQTCYHESETLLRVLSKYKLTRLEDTFPLYESSQEVQLEKNPVGTGFNFNFTLKWFIGGTWIYQQGKGVGTTTCHVA